MLKHEIRFRETFGIGLWACTNSTGECPNDVSRSFWATTSGQARNTTLQVWTVEEGFGIGRLFHQTCCAACAASNLRDHDVLFSFSVVILCDSLQDLLFPLAIFRALRQELRRPLRRA
jgi:hypothetical protein